MYQVFYRKAGCPNSAIHCYVVEAMDAAEAKEFFYLDMDERWTLVGVVEVA